MDRTPRKPPSSGPDATTRVSPQPTATAAGIGESAGRMFRPGQMLGKRYRIDAFLGRGGMGEVWRAFDLKLQVEVALKAIRGDRPVDDRRIEFLRREVRSARDVVSPNVCRIYDLVEQDGHEFVSMEYVDGTTLLAVLQSKGPMQLRAAGEIASQFLAGLEAIHRAGLVHRDVKPENIMITRAGRVVLMDFGLAKPEAGDETVTVAGTPAYMAPEALRGDRVDARADIFSAGVVLAEMIRPEGIRDRASRETLHRMVRQEPAEVPDSPWRPILQRALAQKPAQRYTSAGELIRALEEVTLRAGRADELNPYPGLASFTEAEAEYFFGREQEVEAMWKKLRRPHLLALIGPSGAGKSSFLRAGLIPARPEGWSCLVCTPGNTPVVALGQVLAPELTGDTEAIREMVRFEEPDVAVAVFARWRKKHSEVLLVVDQFEELFTLNPPEVQSRFADLLARLALEADVHVLLSMRDDFLFQCHAQAALAPIQADLTLIGPPTGADLRRALVQPAAVCGYRFEDESLVEEMLGEVKGERGALPLLAFAVAQLWERRDRETGFLTREGFKGIGGVAGALAQHAETTLERIGPDNYQLVREIFRNLVTSQGTRAARDRDELLSVFEERGRAEAVLRELIDARLLTSFEVPRDDSGESESRQRVEIIHESLLEKWPRLVGWQNQDADSARLRDELRHAAGAWHEHGRPDDRLWSGSSYREFELWRERYPGGLTETEEAFARAMVSHATRRRRRRRLAVIVAFAVVVAVAGALGTLWRSSVLESRRAQAQKLVALGQVQLAEFPPAALAYSRASLELTDTAEARRLALDALWRGGGARFLEMPDPATPVFSPDGRWMVTHDIKNRILAYSQEGGNPVELPIDGRVFRVRFLSNGASLGIFTWNDQRPRGQRYNTQVLSFPDGKHLGRFETGVIPLKGSTFWIQGDEMITVRPDRDDPEQLVMAAVAAHGEKPRELRRLAVGPEQVSDFHPERQLVAFGRDRELLVTDLESGAERVLATFDAPVDRVFLAQGSGDRLVATDTAHNVHVLSLERGLERELTLPAGAADFVAPSLGPGGRWFSVCTNMGPIYLWDLGGPPGALPHELDPRPGAAFATASAIDPQGRWQVVSRGRVITFRPLKQPQVNVIPIDEGQVWLTVFTPDGRRLVTRTRLGLVVVPLVDGLGDRSAIDLGQGYQVDVHPDGRSVATTAFDPKTQVSSVIWIPLDGTRLGEPVELVPSQDVRRWSAAFHPSGRILVAGTTFAYTPQQQVLEIIDLENRKVRTCPLVEADAIEGFEFGDGGVQRVAFASDGTLFTAGDGGVRRWDLESCAGELVYGRDGDSVGIPSRDGRFMLHAIYDPGDAYEMKDVGLLDLERGEKFPLLGGQGSLGLWGSFDPSGQVLALGRVDGALRLIPLPDGQPHLLLGHEDLVKFVAVSPDGRRIASVTESEIRLWPMSDLSRPPLHTLPHDELMAKLDTLTNLRAVRDPAASTGWSLEIGPFPGWADLPEW